MTDKNHTVHQRWSPFLRQLLAVSGIVMYMIGTGANIAYPGVLIEQLRLRDSAIQLTEEHESWIASLLGLALISGILVAPFSLQRLGRKLTNQLSTLPTMLGWTLCAVAKDPATLLASRFLQVSRLASSPTNSALYPPCLAGRCVQSPRIPPRCSPAAFCRLVAWQAHQPTQHFTHHAWLDAVCSRQGSRHAARQPLFAGQSLGKLANKLSTLPTMLGWTLCAVAKDPATLLASRFLQGFGMGLQAAAAPVSIAEYSAPKHRGLFLGSIAFSFACGMLVAHVFGTVLYWRSAALACGSFYALSLLLISFTPETPPYLASKGAYSKCAKSFRWLRGSNDESEKELEILLNSQKNQAVDIKALTQSKWKNTKQMFIKPEFYKPTLIMMFMFVLFQISGMTVIPSYTVSIMKEVTGGAIDNNTSMLLVDGVRFATAVLACFILDKFTRRQVLFFGISVTVVSLFMVSLLLFLRNSGYIPDEYKWVPVIPALTYIFGKTSGILPVPWAIAGEIFPLAYRSIGSGISGMFLSIMFFVVVKTAPMSFRQIGVDGTFFVYGICIAICGGFLYFLLPETKGKTLYEIECHFKGITDDKVKDKSERERMLEMQNVEGG